MVKLKPGDKRACYPLPYESKENKVGKESRSIRFLDGIYQHHYQSSTSYCYRIEELGKEEWAERPILYALSNI